VRVWMVDEVAMPRHRVDRQRVLKPARTPSARGCLRDRLPCAFIGERPRAFGGQSIGHLGDDRVLVALVGWITSKCVSLGWIGARNAGYR